MYQTMMRELEQESAQIKLLVKISNVEVPECIKRDFCSDFYIQHLANTEPYPEIKINNMLMYAKTGILPKEHNLSDDDCKVAMSIHRFNKNELNKYQNSVKYTTTIN